jgi:uncharacterized phage-associated protein
LRNAPAAIVTLLEVARADGVVINRTKLAKLLYLADLRAVGELGRPMSGLRWHWYHHGPWDNSFYPLLEDLGTRGTVESEELDHRGYTEHRLRLAGDVEVEIGARFAEIVAEIVQEYGSEAAASLRDLTYQTAPMLEAQREGKPGDALDLNGGAPVPDSGAALARFQGVLDRLPRQDDEGDLGVMADEHAESAGVRARANDVILR